VAWAPDYVTAELLRPYVNVNMNSEDSSVNLWLANWATAVSRNVDSFCFRQFGQTALEERSYSPLWDQHECKTYVEIDDVQDITGLTVEDSNGTVITDYTLLPKNALKKGKPYERISVATNYTEDLVFNAKWGWSAVPVSIPTAAYIQASRLSARKNAPFGIAGSPSDGSEIRLLAQLDPDFMTTLRPFVRKWWAR
jgi:hypothetical protein